MTTRLWDKNGLIVDVEEDEVAAFVEANAHREFGTEERPIRLGCSRNNARQRFVRNRSASAAKRWAKKHAAHVRDELLRGVDLEDATAAADAGWGSAAPTHDEIEADLVAHDLIPATMTREA